MTASFLSNFYLPRSPGLFFTPLTFWKFLAQHQYTNGSFAGPITFQKRLSDNIFLLFVYRMILRIISNQVNKMKLWERFWNHSLTFSRVHMMLSHPNEQSSGKMHRIRYMFCSLLLAHTTAHWDQSLIAYSDSKWLDTKCDQWYFQKACRKGSFIKFSGTNRSTWEPLHFVLMNFNSQIIPLQWWIMWKDWQKDITSLSSSSLQTGTL